MLLVTYNSNPANKKGELTFRGWSLYTEEDWTTLCHNVSNYFFYMAQEEPELLAFGLIGYYSYEEWLADYQVSAIEEYNLDSTETELLDYFLGTSFYEPPFPDLQITVEDYPEMDAYA